MIPQAYITEWSQQVPWQTHEQVEQDLVICRTLVEIFSDNWLASNVAFRGGTALHKLYLQPPLRYSEDIDLVQIHSEPIKQTVQKLQRSLNFLGKSTVNPRKDGIQIIFRFESEFPPTMLLHLKIETNTREHFTVFGLNQFPFQVQSSWYEGNSILTTYRLEELLATKLRALYQRKKGRDLYDIYLALTRKPDIDLDAWIHSYRKYMQVSVKKTPSQKEFALNLEAKMKDSEFLGDTTALLRLDLPYDPMVAYELVKTHLIERI